MSDGWTLLHISDLHFGRKGSQETFLDEAGDAVLRAADAERPDLLVVSGDLSGSALPEELARARRYLDRFQVPHRLVVPGNHDARGEKGLSTFREIVGPTQPCVSLPGLQVVGIDSTEEEAEERAKGRLTREDWHKALRMSKGYVGPEQYPRIARDLEAGEAGAVRVAVLHHHLIGIPGVGIDTDPLLDSGDVLELLARLGVILVLAGHKHRPWTWDVNGMRILHCGTSTSRRYKAGVEDNSYNLVRIGPERVEGCRVSVTTGARTRLFRGSPSPPWLSS